MGALPDHVLRPVGGAHGTASLSELKALAAAFPGPLSSSTPKDKVRVMPLRIVPYSPA
jgi:hypothetical protein